MQQQQCDGHPKDVLLSRRGAARTQVPWYESADMYWRLRDAGVPAKHLVFNRVRPAVPSVKPTEQFVLAAVPKEAAAPHTCCTLPTVQVGHGDFVLDWPTDVHGYGNSDIDKDEWGSGSSDNCITPTGSYGSGDGDGWGSEAAGAASRAAHSAQAQHQQHVRQRLIASLPPHCRDLALLVTGGNVCFVHDGATSSGGNGVRGGGDVSSTVTQEHAACSAVGML